MVSPTHRPRLVGAAVPAFGHVELCQHGLMAGRLGWTST
ncbi:hypothetical protein GZL_09352 [Streptomyces sp. 769]|nr:hypothetical protein GZL_00061 [Streptomyces sp. 769]AJC61870.1 hypothetical protein GZL_09352 [Streptomyces sp. 769]